MVMAYDRRGIFISSCCTVWLQHPQATCKIVVKTDFKREVNCDVLHII